MAGNDEMDVLAILADQGPADLSIAHHGSRAVHCLDTSQRPSGIFDEILSIWSDSECAASIEDDIDDVVARISGDESSNEVRIEVGTL